MYSQINLVEYKNNTKYKREKRWCMSSFQCVTNVFNERNLFTDYVQRQQKKNKR